MNGRTNSNNTVDSELVQLPLDPPSDVNGEPYSGRVELTWTDAKDKYATPEGEVAASPQLMAAKWDRTVVVRKPDTDPSTLSDGTTIVSSDVRNQYQSTPYVDTSVVDGTEYHYGLFSVTDTNILSAPAIIIATPKSGTLLREVSDGTIIAITENGEPAQFRIATHNYESGLNGPGRVLVTRCDTPTDETIRFCNNPDSDSYRYETDILSTWFHETYKPQLSEAVQSFISSTIIHCTSWANFRSPYPVSQDIFAIAARELENEWGSWDSHLGKEGTFIPGLYEYYFSNPTKHDSFWTRTVLDRFRDEGDLTTTGGKGVYLFCTMGVSVGSIDNYPLPCFTLPDTCRINESNILIEE